jgi:hypothetical protein
MSTTNQTAGPSRSNDNFTAIFQLALIGYETLTGKPLRTHPLATVFESCDTPQAVSTVLRTQAHAFSKFRNNNEKLMRWLDPIVHILFTFSTTLGDGVGVVSHLMHSVSSFCDIWFSEIPSWKIHLHCNRRACCGTVLPRMPCRAYV